jgi:hypothetical protein
MSKLPRKFCDNQIECSDRKGVYSCMGHLNEGWVPVCDFDESQIYIRDYKDGNNKVHYEFEIKTERLGGDGICRDFGITPKVGRDIISKSKRGQKIKSELERQIQEGIEDKKIRKEIMKKHI